VDASDLELCVVVLLLTFRDLARDRQPVPVVGLTGIIDTQNFQELNRLIVRLTRLLKFAGEPSDPADDPIDLGPFQADTRIGLELFLCPGRHRWLLDRQLVDRQVEVYRNPVPDPDRPGRFRYADITIVPANGHLVPLAKTGEQVSVAELLSWLKRDDRPNNTTTGWHSHELSGSRRSVEIGPVICYNHFS
jgi:hypothetical protein